MKGVAKKLENKDGIEKLRTQKRRKKTDERGEASPMAALAPKIHPQSWRREVETGIVKEREEREKAAARRVIGAWCRSSKNGRRKEKRKGVGIKMEGFSFPFFSLFEVGTVGFCVSDLDGNYERKKNILRLKQTSFLFFFLFLFLF